MDAAANPLSRPLSVLFMPAQPLNHPSTTSRVLAYVHLLEERGWRCLVSAATPRWMRGLERGPLLARATYHLTWLLRRVRDLGRVRAHDVVFIQRDLFPFSAGILEVALARIQPRFIYDTDDLLHVRQPGASRSPFQLLRPLSKYETIARLASAVTVASDEIRESIERLNDRIEVFPMTIDCAPFDRERARRRERDGVVIGWSGSTASLRYLDVLRPVLVEALGKPGRRFRIITGDPRAVPDLGVPVEVIRWSARTEARDLVDLDIGLLPLSDTPFERGKFPYKGVQYSAAGVPIIASPVGYTRHLVVDSENGYLAADPSEWLRRLDELASSEELRARLGAAARRIAGSLFNAGTHVARLDHLLREVAAAA